MHSNDERPSYLRTLDGLLKPKSIAVVGASDTPGKVGYTVLKNIIDGGYRGKIYPVNLKDPRVQGMKAYPTVLDVPGEIDAAVLVVPAKLCPQVVEECGRKGVRGLIIISSGFSEVGRKDLEDSLVRIAGEHGMRILGPNIVGVLSNSDRMNASFAPQLPLPGKSSLISQSGALIIAIDAATYVRNVGFDKLISIGNMSDVDIADCISWLDADPATACISLYIEGLKGGRRFIEAAQRARKPIVALKAGVSAHGAAAAASHTGSLAGAAAVYEAAFEQAGIVQATDLSNLFDRSLALSCQPPMNGDNLLILTNGGGVGVLATDTAERVGLPLKFAPEDLQAEIRKYIPEFGSARNPVDMTGMAYAEWYYKTVKASFAHPWVNGVVILYCETSLTNPQDISDSIRRAIADSGARAKPVTVAFIGGTAAAAAMKGLVEIGIPCFEVPDKAVNAMAALNEYARIRALSLESADPPRNEAAAKIARGIIESVRSGNRTALTEIEAKQVFAAYGLPVTRTQLARWEDEAVTIAEAIGYPVVLKIVSPDILHKSDAGGVKVNIRDENGLRDAFRTIMKSARAYKADAVLSGIAVQEMAPPGLEVILGSVDDASFGPTVMFGLGGIMVELLRHVTFRVAPVSKPQAHMMLEKIHEARIMDGLRGEAPRDRDALAGVIEKYSRMIMDLRDEIAESDANPCLVYEAGRGVRVVDARIILKDRSARAPWSG
jgi:acetate---CoA ligase (ADP-forming)